MYPRQATQYFFGVDQYLYFYYTRPLILIRFTNINKILRQFRIKREFLQYLELMKWKKTRLAIDLFSIMSSMFLTLIFLIMISVTFSEEFDTEILEIVWQMSQGYSTS